MKKRTSFALLAVFSLMVSCAINPHPMDMTQAVQSAKTSSDHSALAKHYEDAAKEMQAKAEEHKKMLAQYEANKSLYGKQAQSLINHCQGLVRIYEQAAAENMSMAESHRQMAAEAK
jgi:hypothetical protein